MTDKAEMQGGGFDTVKLVAAVVLLLAGVVAFYYFAEESLLARVVGLLLIGGVAAGVVLTTSMGQALWSFLQESRTEVRKMVWPTRAEAMQTTLMVIVVVILMGIMLWLLDMFLGWAVRLFIGHGG